MSHAFTAAIASKDINALIDTLAPNVVLYSAVTRTPFEGREIVADTYRSVVESFGSESRPSMFQVHVSQGTLTVAFEPLTESGTATPPAAGHRK